MPLQIIPTIESGFEIYPFLSTKSKHNRNNQHLSKIQFLPGNATLFPIVASRADNLQGQSRFVFRLPVTRAPGVPGSLINLPIWAFGVLTRDVD
jgi:hypothetical protein